MNVGLLDDLKYKLTSIKEDLNIDIKLHYKFLNNNVLLPIFKSPRVELLFLPVKMYMHKNYIRNCITGLKLA